MTKYKIGIIVTWFGSLPDYFPAWLKSAEANKDVDFLVFCDHEVKSASENIHFQKMSFEETIALCEKKMHRKVNLANAYKFCDARLFFGVIYEDYLREYDFWGYCDIDLIFGNIRHFITDKLLNQYDRFFQYGHLCLYRNNQMMNHLYELPGGIYSLQEIFVGTAKTTPEEYSGANRICIKNNIKWYTNVVFADFNVWYSESLQLYHGIKNHEEQIFVWKNGTAKMIYKENGKIGEQEFIYCHWQKKKPVIEGDLDNCDAVIITPKSLMAVSEINYEKLNFKQINPPVSPEAQIQCQKNYRRMKIKEFLSADFETKKIWVRQKIYHMLDHQNIYQ